MKQKIPPRLLKPGMYVSGLDRPWLESGLPFQGFRIESQEQIDELVARCEYVHVDIDLALEAAPDTAGGLQPPEREPPAARHRIDFSAIRRSEPYENAHDFRTELPEAYVARRATRKLIRQTCADARKGCRLNTTALRKAVQGLLESVLRNPHALSWLTHIKKPNDVVGEHGLNACIHALVFGRFLNLEERALLELGLGALLHDIGKMKIPDKILFKPGPLDERETAIMRRHPEYGYQILSQYSGLPRSTLEIARCHHERANGRGYPRGLKEPAISFFTRIVSIIDVYDASTSQKHYRDGVPANQALDQLFQSREAEFDPELVDAFIKCAGVYPLGSLVEMNTGETAIVTGLNEGRRLHPRVTLILDTDKRPRDTLESLDLARPDEGRQPRYHITRPLPPGSHGINMNEYLVHRLPEFVDM